MLIDAECEATPFSPPLTYQTTGLLTSIPNLLGKERYQFYITALNGQTAGENSRMSQTLTPKKNAPAAPPIPRVVMANAEDVTIEVRLPRMHGAVVYDCDMVFAKVDSCGVAASIFDEFRPFAIGNADAAYLYNLGLMYEVGEGVQLDKSRSAAFFAKASTLEHEHAQAKLDILNGVAGAQVVQGSPSLPPPPVPNSLHLVKFEGLKDDTLYSVKMQCFNEIGVSPMSDYTPPFRTPKIITSRNISLVPFRVPRAYVESLRERHVTTASFFGRFPAAFEGETYTKSSFCRTHPHQCASHPFSHVSNAFNSTRGKLVQSGWYFGQGDDRFCKEEFPKATCRSLSQAIRSTLFEGVTFFIGKGLYRHRGNGTLIRENSWSSAISTNVTNVTNSTQTLPIIHHDEHFPISFPFVGAHLIAMDNLTPDDVVLDCGGQMCFDFTPSTQHSNNHPLVRIQGLTVTGGRAGMTGGAAIYAPKVFMKEWNYNGILQSVFVIQSCIFSNHSSLGNGGALHILSESVVQSWQIHQSTFYGNKAGRSGGAITIDSSVVLLNEVSFESNTALDSGGAVRATSEFVGSAIRGNGLHLVNNIAGNGGGVFAVLGSNLDLKNRTNASDNTALGADGGGFLVAEASTIKMSESSFHNMQALVSEGGAFNVMGSMVHLSGINISGASARSSGGAIASQLTTLQIYDSRIIGSRLTGPAKEKASGGGLALRIRSRCIIENTWFISNAANFAGGAISCESCTSLQVSSGNFWNNTAGRGGAISMSGPRGGEPVSVHSGTFAHNLATVAGGGAIFWERWPPPKLADRLATLERVNEIAAHNESRIVQEKNSAAYGKFIASGPSIVNFQRNDMSIAENTRPFGPRVTLRDNYTNQVIDRDEGVSITLTAKCDTAAILSSASGENIALVSTEGNASFPKFGIAAEPSSMRNSGSPHTVTVTASEPSISAWTFPVSVQDCRPGRYLSLTGENFYACTNCQVGKYAAEINRFECQHCNPGKYQDESGTETCKACPLGFFQSRTGQTKCGDPDVLKWYPIVGNLTRTRNASNDRRFLLTWSWPSETETLVAPKPMVEVATRPDFGLESKGGSQNMTVYVDYESKSSAVVHLPRPVYDMVVYARVRVNSGTAVGEWVALLEPWEISSDCTYEEFLNDLGDRHLRPDEWACERCPRGSTCLGDIRWGQVRPKFGYWRVNASTIDENGNKVDNPSVPDMFEECLFGAACLGSPNTRLAGKFYNVTADESWTEESEDLALSDYGERCNWEWGHSHMCSEYGNSDKVPCRLCQNCRQGFKRQGRSRCRVCPEPTANRVLLAFGALSVVAGFTTVVMVSINSAGAEAELSESIKKVIINHLQICSLAALFPLKWPPEIEAIFALMSAVSSPAQHLLSPDCELSWMSGSQVFYNKQVGYAIMPVGVAAICIVLWLVGYKLIGKKRGRAFAYYHDRIVLTIVCILFLLYPTMVKQSLSGLACERVGAEYYLAVDL
jgi:predicted outer membrane repeat protein